LGLLVFLVISLLMGLVSAAPAKSNLAITGMKWGRTADAVTGSQKIRLVLETNGPVTVDHFVTSKPNWRIILTMRGVNVDKLKIAPSPDGSVVKGMSILKSAKDTVHVVVELPAELTAEQYKVFTLKADPKAKRPFRIVVDVEKSVPLTDLKFSSGLKGKLIALDPGHGGSDPGALGRRGSNENKLNLDLSMLVKTILERAGAKVAMTRTTDVDLTPVNASDRDELRARVMVGNNRKADIFVSIHHNASPNPDMCGTTTYYFRKTNLDLILAQSIHDAMLKGGGLSNQGVRTANFYVVKNALMPAALLEIGFMSNPQEEQTLNNPAFQQKMAVAIVAGIDQFFAQAAKLRGGK
jgi:N-acetylmuramoyl-L-alanine amidase